MGETIEGMQKEIELDENTIIFLTDKIGTSHQETIKHIEKIILTEILDKTGSVIKRLDTTPKIHKKIEFLNNNNNN